MDVNGTGHYIGGLVGINGAWRTQGGVVTDCYSSGAVRGIGVVGGLMGMNNWGDVSRCHSNSVVSGDWRVGGLIGENEGRVSQCCSTGRVQGGSRIGGLIGVNETEIVNCYSTSAVRGDHEVGGLLGEIDPGDVTYCYSTGSVSASSGAGGLIGTHESYRSPVSSFWDTQASGWATSDGGIGKTTAEMQTAKTFLDAGWDFVGETANGTEDIWWILEGKDYPRLWWEADDN